MHSHEVEQLSNKDRDITTVQAADLFDCDEEATILLSDALAALQGAMDKIPPEYRASAVLRLKAYGDYASAYVGVEFKRPETDDEMNARLGWLKSLDDDSEARDRREYKRLAAKYRR